MTVRPGELLGQFGTMGAEQFGGQGSCAQSLVIIKSLDLQVLW